MKPLVGLVFHTLAFANTLAFALFAASSAAAATINHHRFSGTGTRLLPPMRFTHGETLRWSTNGGVFTLVVVRGPTSAGIEPVASSARRGVGYLPAGRYTLKIATFANTSWSLIFQP